MFRILTLVATVCCAALLAAPFGVHAAPSGGGGAPSSGPSGGSRVNPAEAYQEGVAALQARDYRTAVRKLRDVADVAPKDPSVNYAYALALIGAGDGGKAVRPLERTVNERGALPDGRRQLGLLYLQRNEPAKAQEQLALLATALAACDATCGDAQRARLQTAHDGLKTALDAPATPAAPTTGWLLPGPQEGRDAYAAAVGLIHQARYDAALAALDTAAAAIGPHPDILNYHGFASRKLGRFDAAMAYYGEALALDPDHRGATEYLGELYLQLGRVEDARRQLAKLDALCPYGCAEREELSRWIVASR